ncbi:MAG: RDD family protein [Mycobacterium sp.]
MTAVVEETETEPAVEEAAPVRPAGWLLRTGALVTDAVPAIAVVATMALVAYGLPQRSSWWWGCVSVGGAMILLASANRVLVPAVTGWSLGRALFGIAVVRPGGSAVGPGRLLLRDLAHLLDTVTVFVGWLWPLWDDRRRSFADLLLRTEVHRLEPDRRPRDIRRLAAVVCSGAAVLCAAGATLSVLVICAPDRGSQRTREEISAQGPKIVADMLTYAPKTLHDDFARAQSLTTDKYRGQLVEQQQSVEKGHPAVNEYWVTNSAVLSATPDRAAMLLFMQGHRGGEQDRYITATVRVSFVKGANQRWLVDDLAVVTKPKPPKGGK